MSQGDSARVREIFGRLIEAEPAERSLLLNQECAQRPEIAARVLQLLAAHQRAGEFLSTPTIDASTIGLSSDEANGQTLAELGQRIGRYRLIAPLGEGGFGHVFLAEQEQPVRRQVALKIIKGGMDTGHVVAQFEAERQTLALMEHPNIARVFDAGATETGRPFFVMELVRGEPITAYCDANKLSIRQRLQLFLPVCRAVQHAHQKGIIHRDLKPSNVLVTVEDAVSTPKVIDFGIAKAHEIDGGEERSPAVSRHFLGTPQYMSPEQADAGETRSTVDTRSDIYSLGVILYELLSGSLPFDPKQLREAGYEEVRRIIREEAPALPSECITDHVASGQVAASRHVRSPSTLCRMLRGELDWIVIKAMQKNPEQRYETSSDLAADIGRFLAEEPLVAAPPSTTYRLKKFARRYGVALVTAASIFLSLAVGLTLATISLFHAHSAERSEALQHADAVNKLWASYLSGVRASRYSGRSGQRFEGLRALSHAAEIQPSLAVRNEAIACLSVPDVELIRTWGGRVDGHEHMVFAPGLQRYARSDPDGTIHIRAVADDQELMSLPGHGAAVDWSLNFSADGRFLAAVYDRDGPGFVVWDLHSGKPVLQLAQPVKPERGVDFAPDGNRIAVAARRKFEIYTLPAGEKIQTVETVGAVERMRFSPDGRRIAVGMFGRGVTIFDSATAKPLVSFAASTSSVERISWDGDGKNLVTSSHSNKLEVWDPANGTRRSSMEGHLATPLRAEFFHTNRLLLSSSWDYTARLWDTMTGRQLLMARAPGYAMQLADDDRRVGLCTGAMGQLWRVEPGKECRLFSGPPEDDRGWGADLSSDGRVMVAGNRGRVRLWDLFSQRELASLPSTGSGPAAAFFAPDGRALITSGDNGVRVWPISKDGELAADTATTPPASIAPAEGIAALSANGQTLVYDAGAGHLFVKNLAARSDAVSIGVHPGTIRCLAVSPDGHWAATSVPRGTFRVWDLTLCKLATEFATSIPEIDMEGIAFTPDGRWLVGGDAGTYRFWNVASWSLHHSIPRIPAPSPGLMAFAADGKTMAALVGPAETVQLLDPATGAEFATFEDPQMHQLASLSLSRDGQWLVVSNLDHTTTVWDLHLIRKKLAAMKLDW